MEPQRVSVVPEKAEHGTDALDLHRGWAEGSIWTDRLVSALATASKGQLATAPSRLMGCSPFAQPLSRPDTPDAETNDWRAVCGRTARTVRRAGRGHTPSRPLSEVWYDIDSVEFISGRILSV